MSHGLGADARNEKWLLVVLLGALFITNVDVAVVNVAAPAIGERLHATGGQLQLAVSGYVLSYAMLLITGARLGAIHGYRRLFLTGLGIFTFASLACGLAPSPMALILSRIVQGAGAALMVPQVLLGIQLTFSGPARTRALGYYAVTLSGGAVAGQVLGGALISLDLFGSGWRPIFLINLPLGAAILVGALRFLPMDRSEGARDLDLWGMATLSAAVLSFTVPLILGRSLQWPPWTIACLLGSLLPLSSFLLLERRIARRGGHPLINLQFVGSRPIASGLIAYSAVSMTYFALLFILALYLQRGLGRSPLYSGLALVSWVAAFGIGGPLVPRLPSRLAPFVTPLGYFLLALSYAVNSLCTFIHPLSGAPFIAVLGLGGLGLGLGFTANIRHMTATAPVRFAADLSGVITTVAQTAGLMGVAGFGTLYFSLLAPPRSLSPARAFATISAGFALAAAFATFAAYRSGHSAPRAKAASYG